MSCKKFEFIRKGNFTTGCTTLRFAPEWNQADISFNDAELKELFKAMTDTLPVGLIEKWSDETWAKRMILRHEESIANLEIGQKALDTMVQVRGGDIESLKALFDRHYGSVACGSCAESKHVSILTREMADVRMKLSLQDKQLVSIDRRTVKNNDDIISCYTDLKKMREKLLEASR